MTTVMHLPQLRTSLVALKNCASRFNSKKTADVTASANEQMPKYRLLFLLFFVSSCYNQNETGIPTDSSLKQATNIEDCKWRVNPACKYPHTESSCSLQDKAGKRWSGSRDAGIYQCNRKSPNTRHLLFFNCTPPAGFCGEITYCREVPGNSLLDTRGGSRETAGCLTGDKTGLFFSTAKESLCENITSGKLIAENGNYPAGTNRGAGADGKASCITRHGLKEFNRLVMERWSILPSAPFCRIIPGVYGSAGGMRAFTSTMENPTGTEAGLLMISRRD